MRVKKKITKKKLKEPDQFLNFSQKAFLFINHHLRRIVAGGMIVFIFFLATFFYQRWEQGKEEEAYQKFNSAMGIYQMISSPYREGSPTDYKNTLEIFDEVIRQFPRTSSGKFSLLYKGNIHLQLGEFEEAIKAYQNFLQKAGKEKLYLLFAMEGLGYAFEGKKDYEKALTSYQEIIDAGESFQLAGAYLSMGRCYEILGKNKEALESYRSFLKVSQKSSMTNAVLRKISHLENQ